MDYDNFNFFCLDTVFQFNKFVLTKDWTELIGSKSNQVDLVWA